MNGRLRILGASLAASFGLVATLFTTGARADQGAERSSTHSAVQVHAAMHVHEPASDDSEQPAGLPAVTRTIVNYAVPTISLVRDDGRQVALRDEIDDGRPVVLNFIYTSCSGICPLASHVFSELQRQLGAERDRVHLVSISVDPEEDTPSRLREYAQRYSAGPSWQHYTGTTGASIAAQRAFNVYRGDKMGHTPVTLLRPAPGAPWVRFDGFATADMLLKELRGHRDATVASTAH
jgi:protein SCO1